MIVAPCTELSKRCRAPLHTVTAMRPQHLQRSIVFAQSSFQHSSCGLGIALSDINQPQLLWHPTTLRVSIFRMNLTKPHVSCVVGRGCAQGYREVGSSGAMCTQCMQPIDAMHFQHHISILESEYSQAAKAQRRAETDVQVMWMPVMAAQSVQQPLQHDGHFVFGYKGPA